MTTHLSRLKTSADTLRRGFWAALLIGFSVATVYLMGGRLLEVARYFNEILGMVWWLFLWLGAWLLTSVVLLFTHQPEPLAAAPGVNPALRDLLFIEEVCPYVGSLGTFIGLYQMFTGLVFDPNRLAETIPGLIQGMGRALLTSVVGVVGFLVAKYLRERMAPALANRPKATDEEIVDLDDPAVTAENDHDLAA